MINFDNVGTQKTKLKKVKSSIKLQNVFRRVSQGSKASEDNNNSSASANETKKLGKLFGLPLDEVCPNNTIPSAIEVSSIKGILFTVPKHHHLTFSPC